MAREKIVTLYRQLGRICNELGKLGDAIYHDQALIKEYPMYVGIVYGHIQAAADCVAHAHNWIDAGLKLTDAEKESK